MSPLDAPIGWAMAALSLLIFGAFCILEWRRQHRTPEPPEYQASPHQEYGEGCCDCARFTHGGDEPYDQRAAATVRAIYASLAAELIAEANNRDGDQL